MHAIMTQLMTQYPGDEYRREAQGGHRVHAARTSQHPTLPDRLSGSARRFRLILRGAVALIR